MQKQELINTVTALAAPCAQRLGLVLWDVEFVREGADYCLRVTIDSERGIDLAACEAMSREFEPLLDEADPIEVAYQLEVCSPGVERILRTPAHIDAFIGRDVRAKLYKPRPGMQGKELIGRLTARDAATGALTIARGDEIFVLEAKEIARLNAHFDFAAAKNGQKSI